MATQLLSALVQALAPSSRSSSSALSSSSAASPLLTLLSSTSTLLGDELARDPPEPLHCDVGGLCCYIVSFQVSGDTSSAAFSIGVFDTIISAITLLSCLYLLVRLCRARRAHLEFHFSMVVVSLVTFLLLVVANVLPLPPQGDVYVIVREAIHGASNGAQWVVQIAVVLIMFSPTMGRRHVRIVVLVSCIASVAFVAADMVAVFVDHCDCVAGIVVESFVSVFFFVAMLMTCACVTMRACPRVAARPAARRWGLFQLVIHLLFLVDYILKRFAPLSEGKQCMYIVANTLYFVLYCPVLYATLTADSRHFREAASSTGTRWYEGVDGSGPLGADGTRGGMHGGDGDGGAGMRSDFARGDDDNDDDDDDGGGGGGGGAGRMGSEHTPLLAAERRGSDAERGRATPSHVRFTGKGESYPLTGTAAGGAGASGATAGTASSKPAHGSDVRLIPYNTLRLGTVVGAGVHGEVYRATWMGTAVAFKKLRLPTSLTEDDVGEANDLLQTFVQECEILGRLRHPNVLLLLGVVLEPPVVGIVTEFLERGSLFDVLQRKRRDMLLAAAAQVSANAAASAGATPVSPMQAVASPALAAAPRAADGGADELLPRAETPVHMASQAALSAVTPSPSTLVEYREWRHTVAEPLAVAAASGGPPSTPTPTSSRPNTPAPVQRVFTPRPPLMLLFPEMTVVRFMRDVAAGMAFLHSSNIIHRDLKSHNLLIDRAWTVRISDFGISRTIDPVAAATMTAGVGTPQWMAPEVLRAEHYSTKADVYSFGVVCWELLAGRPPYEHLSALQVLQYVTQGRVRLWCPRGAPRELVELVDLCLSDSADARPEFTDIVALLDSLLDRPRNWRPCTSFSIN